MFLVRKRVDLRTVSGETLSPLLALFYTHATTKEGNHVSKNSLKAARGAWQRRLSDLGPEVKIYHDPPFTHANKVFDGVLKQRKREGTERQVQHKTTVTDADWEKLNAYFADILDTCDAVKLTLYVWFQLTLHFYFQGGEMQAATKKSAIILTQVDGKEVVQLAPSYIV